MLSPRETQVLQSMSEGLTAAQVAKAMHLSETTIKHHLTRARKKLGGLNTAHALVLAMREGLVQ